MVESRITRKNLWQRLSTIKNQREWLHAADRLGLPYTSHGSGHYVIRNNNFPESDYRSVIATIQTNLFKEANQTIFKNFLNFGIYEDDIWVALKLLKKK